jgi:S1-C subfamily serine protease
MNNRRSMSWIAGLGCLALLLLVVLPIGLLYWVFSPGGFGLIPETGRIPQLELTPPGAPQDRFERDPALELTPIPTLDIEKLEAPAVPDAGENEGPDAGDESAIEAGIQPPSTLAELYESVSPGTVSIMVATGAGGQMGGGVGSGFVISEEGYIVTNDHVVEGGTRFFVRFYNDVDAIAEVIGVDPDSDLAILRVQELAEGVRPLPLGDSDQVRVGDSVVAIGNPFGLGTSMSYGIVSAVGRTIPGLAGFNIPQAIQTDAAINPGNSGGPLINMRGEVIGVNAQIRTSGAGGGNIGIGFAIPVNILRQIAPDLVSQGFYRWAYLGVSSATNAPGMLRPEQAAQAPRGAVIADVVSGGPAAQAGMRPGDVVIAADGQRINSFEQLLAYIAYQQPGDQIQLTVHRGDAQQEIMVTLGERRSNGIQQ